MLNFFPNRGEVRAPTAEVVCYVSKASTVTYCDLIEGLVSLYFFTFMDVRRTRFKCSFPRDGSALVHLRHPHLTSRTVLSHLKATVQKLLSEHLVAHFDFSLGSTEIKSCPCE